ncbi:MAG: hypothetical protein ACTHOO_01260 [Alcanivorax sp.]
MRRVIVAITVICLVGAIVYAVAEYANTEHRWKYRITVEVETPDGIKTGSSVWEVNLKPVRAGKLKGYKDFYRGEAVLVDLGERGLLFALKKDANSRAYPKNLFQKMFWHRPPPATKPLKTEEKLEYYDNLRNANAIVPKDWYPTFVYFRDLNDPKTIEAVYDRHNALSGNSRQVKVNKLSEVFGQGVEINNIKIETTSDPVRFKLHKILPWLKDEETYIRETPRISTTQPLQYLDLQEGRTP